MEKELSNTINNVLTVLGGALLLYPIIDQAAKTLAPEFEKLQSGEYQKGLEMLTDGKEKEKQEEKPKEQESRHDEIEELKRKLAEYEAQKKQEN